MGPPVVLVSCLPLSPRSCCRWQELTTVTQVPGDQLVLLETSPRLPTLLLRPPTPTLPQTCGRRLSSKVSLPGVHRLPVQEPQACRSSETRTEAILKDSSLFLEIKNSCSPKK